MRPYPYACRIAFAIGQLGSHRLADAIPRGCPTSDQQRVGAAVENAGIRGQGATAEDRPTSRSRFSISIRQQIRACRSWRGGSIRSSIQSQELDRHRCLPGQWEGMPYSLDADALDWRVHPGAAVAGARPAGLRTIGERTNLGEWCKDMLRSFQRTRQKSISPPRRRSRQDHIPCEELTQI